MSEENRRELEPRFYRAVGATGPQSEKSKLKVLQSFEVSFPETKK